MVSAAPSQNQGFPDTCTTRGWGPAMHSVQRRKINSTPRIEQGDKTSYMSFGAFESPNFLLQEIILFQKTCLHSKQSQISHLKFPKQKKNTIVLVTNITSNQVHLKLRSEKCRFRLIHASWLTWAVLCACIHASAVFKNINRHSHLSIHFVAAVSSLCFPKKSRFDKKKIFPHLAACLEAVKKPMDATGMKPTAFQRRLGEGRRTYS